MTCLSHTAARDVVGRSPPGAGGRPAGIVSVLALIFLVIFSALGASYTAFANGSLLQGRNHADRLTARFQAESGMSFLLNEMNQASIPAGTDAQTLLNAVATGLQTRLDGSANLGAAVVAYDGATIAVPTIATDHGQFSAAITSVSATAVLLRVTGVSGAARWSVGIECAVTAGGSSGFDYGIAANGKIRMTGNARIQGANNPGEASLLSGGYDDDEAFKLVGNCRIDGDIYASNPDAYATLTGNVSVGGEGIWSGEIEDHIHIGIGEVEFPEVDPTVFEPFAANIVDAGTSTNGNRTFTNIRILAGVNPTFSGNITINGVVFIEAPNQVHFSGNVTITGVIVTQDAGEDVHETNTIKFTGNTTSHSVADLPDTPEFHDLRELPGSFLLAPGFGVQFSGNFGTVNGAMAADRFKWTGNAGGTIHGPLISYGGTELKLTGNSNLTIDRSTYPGLPPGLAGALRLQPDVGTYREN